VSRGFLYILSLTYITKGIVELKKPNMATLEKDQEVVLRWFWNPPTNGYSIEDCELFIRQFLLKTKNEEEEEE